MIDGIMHALGRVVQQTLAAEFSVMAGGATRKRTQCDSASPMISASVSAR